MADKSHSFHLDHAASLPYVMAKTNFKGRVFMTHPTKAIYKWLMQDSVRVQYVYRSLQDLGLELTIHQEHPCNC
jgi:cleavage and polyadenylation specificity factor subunit 3